MGMYFQSKYTAQQIEATLDAINRKPQSISCENCGAPLNKYGGCDYCGTGKQTEEENIKLFLDGSEIAKTLFNAWVNPQDALSIAYGDFYKIRSRDINGVIHEI